MSSEWTDYTFEQLKAPSKSAFAMGPFGSNIKAENFVSSGVPVIKGGNLNGTYLGEVFTDFLTEKKAAELTSSKARALDIIITHRGTLGQVGLIPEHSKYPEYIVSQSQLKLSFDRSCVDPYFIYYFLRSPLGQQRLLSNTSQVGVPAIAQALTTIRQIKVDLPTLSRQSDISSVLRALDDRITLLRETNATLEAIAQALFKSWFVDFDPVRAKMEGRAPEGMDEATASLFPDGLEESDLGLVPRGWRVGVLQDLLLLQRGFDLPSQDRIPGDYPIIAASGPSGTHAVAMAKGPGVVTGRSGVLGRVFLELEDYWPLNTTLWVKEFLSATPCYAYELLRLLDFQSFNAGSAVPTLNRNHIHSLRYLIPPKSCVEAYESLALQLQVRVRLNNQQAQTLATLRDTLLPRLISGALRLPESVSNLDGALA